MLMTITELDAINQILSAIGSDPVMSLEDNLDIDVVNARRLLKATSRHIQRQGWDFNKTTRKLTPDEDTHYIAWDDTIITLSSIDGNTYVKRGDWLYNMTEGTYEFPKPIEVTITYGVEFDDLPDCFKEYVTAKTALDFQSRYFGDTTVSQDLQLAMQMAYQDIVNYDLNMSNANMLTVAGVSEVLQRT